MHGARGGTALNLASNFTKQASKAAHHVAQAMTVTTQRVLFVVFIVLLAWLEPGRGRGSFSSSSSGGRRRTGRQGSCHRSGLSSYHGRSFQRVQRRRLMCCRVHRSLTLARSLHRLFISEFPKRVPRSAASWLPTDPIGPGSVGSVRAWLDERPPDEDPGCLDLESCASGETGKGKADSPRDLVFHGRIGTQKERKWVDTTQGFQIECKNNKDRS